MKLVFCGTPQFAVPALHTLLDNGFEIPLVVSQPDRPSGRGMQVLPTPVKQLAQERGVAVTQPEKIKNNPEFRAQLEAIAPEAIVVVAYGRIMEVMGTVNAAGFTKVALISESSDGAPGKKPAAPQKPAAGGRKTR